MARLLGIDLDIFVSPIECMHRNNRPQDDLCDIWPAEDVRRFLEDVCHLDRNHPTPGLVFEEHDELFDGAAWLIEQKAIAVPFDLVHVDAHADIACGQGVAMSYVL